MPGLIRKPSHRGAEIPSASMADIAFLLLIFFLVATTIDSDTGIGMTLPPKIEGNVEPPPVHERNMLRIRVNDRGKVLVDDKPSTTRNIRAEVKKHVTNRGVDPDYAENPERAIVSVKTDRLTPYSSYIEVLDEIWMAYGELWDAEARRMGYPSYDRYVQELPDESANIIRARYKPNVSLAEPDPGS